MKPDNIIFIVCILVLAFTLLYAHKEVDINREVRYNCDLAEISPDFPVEVKQKCRELRHENRTSK